MTRRNFPHHPSVFHRCKKPEQLSADSCSLKHEQVSVLEDESANSDQVEPVSSSLIDYTAQKQTPTRKAAPARRKTPRSGSKRRAAQRLRKRTGGWSVTTGLAKAEVTEITDIWHELTKRGYPLGWLITVQPPDDISSDAERTAYCRKRIDNLKAKLRRRGIELVALWVFEKASNGKLHAHALVHIPRHLQDEFAGWADGLITDIRKAKPWHIGYITKQGPSSHRLKKSAPFRGKRWSLTPAAKAVLSEGDA
jgi:hypothetical protein